MTEVDGSDVVFSFMSHENEVGVMDDGEELLFTSGRGSLR